MLQKLCDEWIDIMSTLFNCSVSSDTICIIYIDICMKRYRMEWYWIISYNKILYHRLFNPMIEWRSHKVDAMVSVSSIIFDELCFCSVLIPFKLNKWNINKDDYLMIILLAIIIEINRLFQLLICKVNFFQNIILKVLNVI